MEQTQLKQARLRNALITIAFALLFGIFGGRLEEVLVLCAILLGAIVIFYYGGWVVVKILKEVVGLGREKP